MQALVLLLGADLVHELHAAELELLDGGHVNLGHVVRLVARVNVLGDGLGLLNDEAGPLVQLLLARLLRRLQSVAHLDAYLLLAKLCS